jgi:hypothetical protein
MLIRGNLICGGANSSEHGRTLIRKFGRKLIEFIVLLWRTLNEIERISVHVI